ncbi:MAG: hypothetical protein LBE83_00945 [Propionibacteriaceae bacterium]|jgi:MFS family permease|nr:hypothetical protein [Propionibacteriaceae bacterium]
MSLQIKDTPWGFARFTYSYLASLLAGFATALLGVVGYSIILATPVCDGDELGLCMLGLTGIWIFAAAIAALFIFGYVFALGWQWAAWFVAAGLILFQIVIETSLPGIAWILLGFPALAATLSFQRPDRDESKLIQRIKFVALGVIVIEFGVWLVFLAFGA